MESTQQLVYRLDDLIQNNWDLEISALNGKWQALVSNDFISEEPIELVVNADNFHNLIHKIQAEVIRMKGEYEVQAG